MAETGEIDYGVSNGGRVTQDSFAQSRAGSEYTISRVVVPLSKKTASPDERSRCSGYVMWSAKLWAVYGIPGEVALNLNRDSLKSFGFAAINHG
jgi:hypothetical protein